MMAMKMFVRIPLGAHRKTDERVRAKIGKRLPDKEGFVQILLVHENGDFVFNDFRRLRKLVGEKGFVSPGELLRCETWSPNQELPVEDGEHKSYFYGAGRIQLWFRGASMWMYREGIGDGWVPQFHWAIPVGKWFAQARHGWVSMDVADSGNEYFVKDKPFTRYTFVSGKLANVRRFD